MRALMLDPSVENWLREETDGLAWPPEARTAASAYDSQHAPRLDAVVKEVMRMTPPVGGFFRRTTKPITLQGVAIPADRVIQVALAASDRDGPGDLDSFRPSRHMDNSKDTPVLMPFGGGERVCLGKALAELEIRLMVVGLLQQTHLTLAPDQDLSLQLIPSPTPKDQLLVMTSPRPDTRVREE